MRNSVCAILHRLTHYLVCKVPTGVLTPQPLAIFYHKAIEPPRATITGVLLSDNEEENDGWGGRRVSLLHPKAKYLLNW